MFLCQRLPADGTILAPLVGSAFPQLNSCNAAGHVLLANYCVEFFQMLQCRENPEQFSIGCYRSGQIVKLRRILNRAPSLYVRSGREFKDSIYGFVRNV
jgi:hypothetical protein